MAGVVLHLPLAGFAVLKSNPSRLALCYKQSANLDASAFDAKVVLVAMSEENWAEMRDAFASSSSSSSSTSENNVPPRKPIGDGCVAILFAYDRQELARYDRSNIGLVPLLVNKTLAKWNDALATSAVLHGALTGSPSRDVVVAQKDEKPTTTTTPPVVTEMEADEWINRKATAAAEVPAATLPRNEEKVETPPPPSLTPTPTSPTIRTQPSLFNIAIRTLDGTRRSHQFSSDTKMRLVFEAAGNPPKLVQMLPRREFTVSENGEATLASLDLNNASLNAMGGEDGGGGGRGGGDRGGTSSPGNRNNDNFVMRALLTLWTWILAVVRSVIGAIGVGTVPPRALPPGGPANERVARPTRGGGALRGTSRLLDGGDGGNSNLDANSSSSSRRQGDDERRGENKDAMKNRKRKGNEYFNGDSTATIAPGDDQGEEEEEE